MAMKNNILGYEMLDCKKIKKSAVRKAVRKKLKTKDEVVIMKMSRMKKLAIAGAVTGTVLLSFTTVNAATNGAVMDKISDSFTNIRIFINGKEVEKEAVVKYDDGDTIVVEVEGDGDDLITVEGIPNDIVEAELTIDEYDYGDIVGEDIRWNGTVVGETFSSNDVKYDPEKR